MESNVQTFGKRVQGFFFSVNNKRIFNDFRVEPSMIKQRNIKCYRSHKSPFANTSLQPFTPQKDLFLNSRLKPHLQNALNKTSKRMVATSNACFYKCVAVLKSS